MADITLSNASDSDGRLDRVTLTLSLLLFLSPWAMGYSDVPTACATAWISAVVIAVFSAAATLRFAEWEEWVNLVAGLWLLAAPWILGFHRDGDSVGAFVGIGVLIVAISASEIFELRQKGAGARR